MQKVQAVAPELNSRTREVTLDVAPAPALGSVDPRAGVLGLVSRLRGYFTRLTDTQLSLVISAFMFVFAAWPLALTEVPPYQDLPNHLAAVTVIHHPEQYPEFAFNGWFKTNS